MEYLVPDVVTEQILTVTGSLPNFKGFEADKLSASSGCMCWA